MGLRHKHLLIAEGITSDQRIIYVDYPLHPNVGDLLINLGTEKFFADYNLNVWKRYTYHDFPQKLKGITDNDIFMFHGGGNFGDIYPEHLDLLQQIITQYPKNRIIVLPQTIYFKDQKRLRETCAKFAKHDRLDIFVRDEPSMESLTAGGLRNIAMMPDMAHQLTGELPYLPESNFSKPLYFFRKDPESRGVPSALTDKSLLFVDWNDSFSIFNHVSFHLIYRIAKYGRTMGSPIHMQKTWYPVRDGFVKNALKMFSLASVVYTDRLHAMLLSLLIGKPVFAFDNSYGKLTSYYNAWLREVPLVTLMDKSDLLTR